MASTLGGIRRYDLDRDAVTLAHGLDHAIRFFRKPAGIQRENANRRRNARRHVDDHHALRLKRGGDGKRAAELA